MTSSGSPSPPSPEVPTEVQLGISKFRMLARGVAQACPVCGGRQLFRRWFTMVERCPTCSLRFERAVGQSIGYIGINTIVCFGATFIVLLGGAIIQIPDIKTGPLFVAVIMTSGVLPIAFYPSSRTLWTAIDILLRPLRAGEVDPRLILVDPKRDKPAS